MKEYNRMIVISEKDIQTGKLTQLDEMTLFPGDSPDSDLPDTDEVRAWLKWWKDDKRWILRMVGVALRDKYRNEVQP